MSDETVPEVLAFAGQMGGKYPMGFVFTTTSGDFTDIVPYTELDLDGLNFPERMQILEVARLDAEFWMNLKRVTKQRIQHACGALFFTGSSDDEGNLAFRSSTDESANKGVDLKEEVREHIEIFVSAVIGKSVDKAFIGKLSDDPGYKKYFFEYHPLITRSLSKLSLSVFKAIRGESLLVEDLPTSAHALAKTVIVEAQLAAKNLLNMKEPMFSNAGTSTSFNGLSDSYEGLLASAILNTAFEDSRSSKKEFGIQTDEPSVLYRSSKVDTGVQSDLPFSDSDSDDCVSAISTLTYPTNCTETADEFSYYRPEDQMNVNLTLVQEVEELVTVVDDVDEKSRMYSGTIEKFLSSLSDCQSDEGVMRTSFPEFGMDIVDGGFEVSSPSCDFTEFSVCERRSAIDNWEENWLFRHRKDSAPPLLNFTDFECSMVSISDEPIGMFVPMPSIPVTPTVGDKEIDLLSDLSERESYGSLDFSSSDSEKELNDTGQQSDLTSLDSLEQKERESTEHYASLPIRLLSPPTSLATPVEPFSEEMDEKGFRIPNFVHPEARNVSDEARIKFLVKPENVTVGLGKCLKVHCRPVCSSHVGVAWFFHGRRLMQSDRVLLVEEHGTWTLEVYDVSNNDSGRYSVVAYSEDSQSWTDFSVRVVGRQGSCSPAFLSVPSDVCYVIEGQDAKIAGQVLGHPEPRLSLTQSPTDRSRVILERSVLGSWVIQIRKVRPEDTGSYVLQAWNRLGGATVTFQLVLDQKQELDTPLHPVEEPPQPKKRSKVPRKVQEVLPIPRLRKRSVATQDLATKAPEPITCSPSFDEILSAQPGSIAEREHKKWSHAVSMPNNPYSAESLLKRLQSKNVTAEIRPFTVHLPSDMQEEHDYDWLGSYRGDYVVAPQPTSPSLMRKIESQGASAPALIRERKVSESENDAAALGHCRAKSASASQQVQSVDSEKKSNDKGTRNFDKVANAKLVKNVRNERSKSRERPGQTKQKKVEAEEARAPVLPSVKQLASIFKSSENSSAQVRPKGAKSRQVEGSEDVLTSLREPQQKEVKIKNKVVKSVQEHDEQGLYRIHSLTARSVPQEFRKGLDLSRGRQQDRNIKLPSPSRAKSDSENPEDAGGNSKSVSADFMCPAARKALKDSIAKRAAFWDNRIVNGIVEDGEVTDEFPDMTEF